MRIRLSAAALVAMLMLTGCGKENAAVGVIGGADGPTAVVVGESFDPWEYDVYAQELNNKYMQYVNDSYAFDEAYYSDDINIDTSIEAAEKCIFTLNAVIAAEPPAALVQYHQAVIDGAQREIRYYEIMLQVLSLAKETENYSEQERDAFAEEYAAQHEQEIAEMDAFLDDYSSTESMPIDDAYTAAMEAATGYYH